MGEGGVKEERSSMGLLVADHVSRAILDPRSVVFEHAYRDVYNLCIHGHGHWMNDLLSFAIQRGANMMIGRQTDTAQECRAAFGARVQCVKDCVSYWMGRDRTARSAVIDSIAEASWSLALRRVTDDRYRVLDEAGFDDDVIERIMLMTWPPTSAHSS